MVVLLGAKYPGNKIVQRLKQKNINAIFVSPSLHDRKFKNKIASHKVIHYIGSPTVSFHGLLTLFRFKLWKKKILVTWRGSDILIAHKNIVYRFLTRKFQFLVDMNTTLSQKMVDELNNIGIDAKLQPNT